MKHFFQVLEGEFDLLGHELHFASGSSLLRFPPRGRVFYASGLKDQAADLLLGKVTEAPAAAVLGLLQEKGPAAGRLVLFGDSNCVDSAHMVRGAW